MFGPPPQRPVFENTKTFHVITILEPVVSDHLWETTENSIMRCCNIIVFFGSTRHGHFSMGSTGFFLEVDFSKTKTAHTLYSISFKTDDLNVVKNTVTPDSLSAQEQSTVGVPK